MSDHHEHAGLEMPESESEKRELFLGMRISVAVGFLMLIMKVAAWRLTGSAAILSDAAESIVHVAAVLFAAYSLRLSYRPADQMHAYGHAKIGFFSAGFEGGMIVLAALYILYESISKLIVGPEVENLGLGTILIVAAVLINGALGAWLLFLGKKHKSLILRANGKHVLTDCWTSLGVVLALVLILLTGWLYWDPIFGILMALNILRTGVRLMIEAGSGLMDGVEPETTREVEAEVEKATSSRGLRFHRLKVRPLGDRLAVEFHLLMPDGLGLQEAHKIATKVEWELRDSLHPSPMVSTHLEPFSTLTEKEHH